MTTCTSTVSLLRSWTSKPRLSNSRTTSNTDTSPVARSVSALLNTSVRPSLVKLTPAEALRFAAPPALGGGSSGRLGPRRGDESENDNRTYDGRLHELSLNSQERACIADSHC
jgi:hypothetical protein